MFTRGYHITGGSRRLFHVEPSQVQACILPYDFPRFKFPFVGSPISSIPYNRRRLQPIEVTSASPQAGTSPKKSKVAGVPTSLLMSSARIQKESIICLVGGFSSINGGESPFIVIIKGSWEAILPCYGQIEFCDLKWCRVVDHITIHNITIHNKRIRSSGIDFDEGWW